MAYKNFAYDRPEIAPAVPAGWFRKGGAGQRLPQKRLETITHWSVGGRLSRRDEVLNPESPLAREVLGVVRWHPQDVLLAVEVLSPASKAKVDHLFDCDCEPVQPFDWFYAA